MVLPASHGISRVPCYLGTLALRFKGLNYRAITFCGRPFQTGLSTFKLYHLSSLLPQTDAWAPQRHRRNAGRLTRLWFGLFPVRSPLLGKSRLFSSPPGTKMFQFPGFSTSSLMVLGWKCPGMIPGRLPHSEIPGSKLACSSPRLIAAGHVLHRLLTPRHPP